MKIYIAICTKTDVHDAIRKYHLKFKMEIVYIGQFGNIMYSLIWKYNVQFNLDISFVVQCGNIKQLKEKPSKICRGLEISKDCWVWRVFPTATSDYTRFMLMVAFHLFCSLIRMKLIAFSISDNIELSYYLIGRQIFQNILISP